MSSMLIIILLAGGTMLVLAMFMTYVLGWANQAFHVEVDPRVEKVIHALPGANCGGCGYVGCGEYAEAVVEGTCGADKCPVGGDSCAAKIAEILGLELEQSWPHRPVVHCGATGDERLKKHPYSGEQTCTGANLVGGVQGCTYGCLGFGDCAVSCDFDAIHVNDGLATVDYHKCIGCGACENACPRHIIHMVPFKAEKMVVVACSNGDFGKEVRGVCKVGCLGCGSCARLSDLFEVKGNIARIDYDKYDPGKVDELSVVLEKCPMKRIIPMGKPSAADLAAVAGEQVDDIVRDEFETTVDKTEWHG